MAIPALSLVLPSSRSFVPSSFFILLFFIKLIPSPRARFHKLKLALLALVFLNWRSLPFYWHIKQSGYALAAWWRFGIRRKVSEFAGKSPFVATVKRSEVCSWDMGDYNMHMNNSSYAKVLDYSRMQFWADVLGPGLGRTQSTPILVGSYLSFYSEIPIGSKFTIETRLASWDDKFVYLLSRFVATTHRTHHHNHPTKLYCIAISQYKSKFTRSISIPPSPSASAVTLSTGAVTTTGEASRSRGSKLTIQPSKLISTSGLGRSENWKKGLERAKDVEWLLKNGVEESLEEWEKERLERLVALKEGFGGESGRWKEL